MEKPLATYRRDSLRDALRDYSRDRMGRDPKYRRDVKRALAKKRLAKLAKKKEAEKKA